LATGVAATELRLAGGGSFDPRWRQLLADVLEQPLLATATTSASALGAALLAGVGFGAWPDAQRVAALAAPPTLVATPGSPAPAARVGGHRKSATVSGRLAWRRSAA